jgi:hypothetical protein
VFGLKAIPAAVVREEKMSCSAHYWALSGITSEENHAQISAVGEENPFPGNGIVIGQRRIGDDVYRCDR